MLRFRENPMKMLNSKPIIKFFLIFVLTYGILIAASPFLRVPAGIYYAEIGNKFLQSPVQNSLVTFSKINEKDDIVVHVMNISQRIGEDKYPGFKQKYNSYNFSYLPGALLIALILASPVNIKRKLLSLVLSVLCLHLLMVFRMYVIFLYIWNHHLSSELTGSVQYMNSFIDWMFNNIVNHVTILLFIVVFIWLAVTFRKEDLGVLRCDIPIHAKGKIN
jgi:hypothetical protein